MRTGTRRRRRAIVLCACMAWVTRAGMTRPAPASTQTAVEAMVVQSTPLQPPLLLRAARLVNGQQRHDNAAVVVSGRTIAALGAADQRRAPEAFVRDLGATTMLPQHAVQQDVTMVTTLAPLAHGPGIAVRGHRCTHCKLLEYPDVVISRGRIVVNHGEHCGSRVVPRPRHTPVSRGCAHHPRPRTAL